MLKIVIRQLLFNRVNYLNALKVLSTPQNRYKSNKFGHTFVLIQDGSDIRELPLIVRNVCGNEICCEIECPVEPVINKDELVNKLKNLKNETDRKKADEEIVDVIRGFKKCSSVKSLVDLLEIVMLDEITPVIALCALKKIVELENFKFHIATNRLTTALDSKPSIDYTKTPMLEKLLDIIIKSDDHSTVIGTLELIPIDRVKVLPSDIFKNKLSEEILSRITESKLNIDDICRSIDTFSKLNKIKTADQLWIGIMDKSNQIDEKNVVQVFRILYLLKKSRKTIMNMLERRLKLFWHSLCIDDIIEILYTMRSTKCTSNIVLNTTSRWINTNIHTLNENNLTSFVVELSNINYVDIGIVRALERYIKAKCSTLNSPILMVEIMNYCSKFNIRSKKIFDGCAEYIINSGSNATPSQFRDLFWPFGQLNYKPKNIEFWKKIENITNKEFFNFKTQEAIDILLSCVYLEKHPLNFIHRIFTTSFLHHLYNEGDKNDYTRTKLKLIDQCMTLECEHYRGPVIPKDKLSSGVWWDFRIKQILKDINNNLEKVFEGYKISYSIILSQLPLMSIYIIDALVHPAKYEMNSKYLNFKTYPPGLCTAILIHLPEHYCWESEHLTGIETTRIRHFRKIGLNVMFFNYKKLIELKYPAELTEYINHRYTNMLAPF